VILLRLLPFLSGPFSNATSFFAKTATGSDDTSSSDSGLGSLYLSFNATESTTVSNCNYFTGVNGYDKGGMDDNEQKK
jgi:hypothetical protein